jgi:hypothetical protein
MAMRALKNNIAFGYFQPFTLDLFRVLKRIWGVT